MDQLLKQNVPVASSCGGDGICGKCVIKVSPTKSFKEAEPLELKKLEQLELGSNCRLSCQLFASDNGTLDTEYW